MDCPECNAALEDQNQYRFCPYCGTGLATESNSSPDDSAPQQAPGSSPGRRKFSETSWFMAASKPEDLSDATAENFDDIETMTDSYENPGKLPSQIRKKYSLSETVQTKPAKVDPTDS